MGENNLILNLDDLLNAEPALDRATEEEDRKRVLAAELTREGELGKLVIALRDAGTAYLYSDKAVRPDWSKLIQDARQMLKETARQTRALTWLVEALVQEHGWVGFEIGLKLFRLMLERHGDTLRPAPDKSGGRLGRYASLFNNNEPAGQYIKLAPLAFDRIPLVEIEGRPVSLAMFEAAVRSARTIPTESEIKDRLDLVSPADRLKWMEAAGAASAELQLFCAAANADLSRDTEISVEVRERNFKKLAEWRQRTESRINHCIKDANMRFAGSASAQKVEASTGQGDTSSALPADQESALGVPQTRAEALGELKASAEFFELTDPHSIVSYHIRRGERWMILPVAGVIDELVGDSHPLRSILPKRPAVPMPALVAAAVPVIEQIAQIEPLAEPAKSRSDAVRRVQMVLKYLASVEQHSFAKFPLAFAVDVANIPIEQIIESAVADESERNSLLKALGVTFLKGSKK